MSSSDKRNSISSNSGSSKRSKTSDPASRIAELEAELAIISASKGRKFKPNTEELTRIKTAIKVYVWRQVKFITNHDQAKQVCKMVWKHIKMFRRDEELTQKTFTYKYVESVLSSFTQIRSYQMAQMEKSYQSYREKPKPTLDEMELCLWREINIKDERQKNVFLWYLDCYLPKATGSSQLFGPNHRRYATISKVVTAEDKKLQVMTPKHEAFAVLTFENNLSRWQYYDKLCPKHGHLQFLLMKKKHPSDVDKTVEECVKGKASLRIYSDKCKGKYTLLDNGQSKYGGWTAEGMNRYKVLLTAAKLGRANVTCEPLEKEALKEIRLKVGLTAVVGADDEGPALFKKTPKNADVDTWDFDFIASDSEDNDCSKGSITEGEDNDDEISKVTGTAV